MKYKERLELAKLPELIESQEAEIATLHQAMAEPAFYQQAGEAIAEKQNLLKDLEQSVAKNYQRWEELEELNN